METTMSSIIITKSNNFSMTLTLILGLQQEKWDYCPPRFSRRTVCPKRPEKLSSKQNQEIRLFPSNHLLWIERFGITCLVKPKTTIETSEDSYINFRQSSDLSITPYGWFTPPRSEEN